MGCKTENYKRRYKQRLGARLCTRCGKPLHKTGRRCQECADKAAAFMLRRYHAKPEGLCRVCTNPVRPGYRSCVDHSKGAWWTRPGSPTTILLRVAAIEKHNKWITQYESIIAASKGIKTIARLQIIIKKHKKWIKQHEGAIRKNRGKLRKN